ncbi:hypothetical protein WKI68_42905 [Streptomyces sp. MS1.HAVA.3]|uniref:Uncharacterized protein n=1 Tax=Streptomyces caledonius TaxID=3134107 RepID=A0ABU8UE39_9ACTN
MNEDARERPARRGRPPSPLPPGLSKAERDFLERMRTVASQAGGTREEVSQGLSDLVKKGSSPGTAASVSELSKMLSGKRTVRPAVITGLHTLAGRSEPPGTGTLDREIRKTRALFYGWLEVRDPALWRYYRLQEVLDERSSDLRDAERLVEGLAGRLEDARSLYASTVRRLTELTEGAYGDLANRKNEILDLTARIRQGAQEIRALEEALEDAWRAIRRHAEQFARTAVEIAEQAEQLTEDDSQKPEPARGRLVEWLRSLNER